MDPKIIRMDPPHVKASSKVRSMVEKFCTSTSLHGISRAYRSPKIYGKVFWAIVLTFGVAGLTLEMFVIMENFFHYPKATKISIVHQDSMPFPDVLVCQQRSVRRSYAHSIGVSDELAEYILHVFAMTGQDYYKYYNLSREDVLEQEYLNLIKILPKRDIRTFLMEAGPKCESFFKFCSFNGVPFDCCTGVEERFDLIYGKCFLFTGKQLQDWPSFGLEMEVAVFPSDFYPEHLLNTVGVSLRVMDEYNELEYTEILVPTDRYVAIALTQQVLERGNVDQTCSSDAIYARKKDCEYDCWHRLRLEHCGCSYAINYTAFKPVAFFPICSPKVMLNCQAESPLSYHPEELKSCINRCLPRCIESRVHSTVTYANLVRRELGVHDGLQGEERVYIALFFDEFSTTYITEVPTMTFDTVVANVGGALGIFLGASFITFIELAAFLVSIAWRYLGDRIPKIVPN